MFIPIVFPGADSLFEWRGWLLAHLVGRIDLPYVIMFLFMVNLSVSHTVIHVEVLRTGDDSLARRTVLTRRVIPVTRLSECRV